ncbi:MAG: ABC transporter permease [Candidatus Riflebacteria bacterium]|nr:ABC transporter permease [Candidatus Riflebacteria bacterium]
MKLSRNLVLSLEILAAHKPRTLLSVSGIVVGVGAVVLMVSTGRGAEKQIMDRIRGMGTNLLIVNAGRTSIIAGRQRQMETVRTLLVSDAKAIAKECSSVARAGPGVSKKLAVRWEDQDAMTSVVGLSLEGFACRNITVASGRLFDEGEGRAAKRLAVLGPTASTNLLGKTDPVGQQIRIGKVPFEVIGVAAPRGMDVTGADQDDVILVPLETAMRRLFNVTYVHAVYAQTPDSAALANAEKEIASLLRQRHRLRNKPDDFTIQNQATVLETEKETTGAMTLLIGSVAGISLVVGGVGILAVMLMFVRERTREIGLRRALGALRRDIRNQFLFESAMLSGAGGVIGVLGGLGLAWTASTLGYWPAALSWLAAAVAFTFSVAVGIAFGLYPAVRAASLEPIQALRSER